MKATSPVDHEIYTVSRLNREIRTLLERQFPSPWVEGEVSNLSRPSSGHLYFTLKDEGAQIRCALFQNRARLFRGCPHNGQKVLVRGRISLYELRGDYQLIVEYVEDAGAGTLRQAYEALRLRLEQENLFAQSHKKTLPRFPQRIGVITSPTGAAIHDVLSTLERRFPSIPVLIYPVQVQGDSAANQIAKTIHCASTRRECDVLLLVRGGGSLEDLWAFNEEVVARAIFDCTLPLVTGIGHESDITIADFVADLRASTPTASAERVSPDRLEWLHNTGLLLDRLNRALQRHLGHQQQRFFDLNQRLQRQHPRYWIQNRAQQLDELDRRLQRIYLDRMNQKQLRLAALAGRLNALSPLATLQRGYAIARHKNGAIARQAAEFQPGDTLDIILNEGQLYSQVTAVNPDRWKPQPDQPQP